MYPNTNVRTFPFRTSTLDVSNIINQRVQLVRGFPMFSEIALEDCAKIVVSAQERNFERGKAIFFQGDTVQQVLLLTSGSVKLSQFSPDGQEVILRLIGPGENVSAGESCTKCAARCSTARTLQRSSALVWEAKTFEAVAERFPILRRNIGHDLQRLMNQLEERYLEVCTQKVAPRLSSQIVRLLTQVGKRSEGHVEIALSQRDLAQLTGTTLFTVSRLLSQWEVKGIVKARREAVMVLDVPGLVELSRAEDE